MSKSTAPAYPAILQFSLADRAGGAEEVAATLQAGLRARTIAATLAVGYKHEQGSDSVAVPQMPWRSAWARSMDALTSVLDPQASAHKLWLRRLMRAIGEPARAWQVARGYDDWDWPGTTHLPELASSRPGILHTHVLRDRFDLRQLPVLSRQMPLVATQHDQWLMTGWCTHAYDCRRWRSGCGHCPQRRALGGTDRSAEMWRRKRDIYTHSHLYLVCPSHWLEKEVSASILADGAAELCVIPNGVDEQLFCPANRDAKALARTGLGIEADEFVVAFCAVAGSDGRNPDKDPLTLVHALRQLATLSKRRRFCLLIIGDIALEDTELAGGDGLRLIRTGRLAGGRAVAGALAAADLYAHAAFAENFPLALLEAAACGLACVASDVGGAAEIIEAGVSGLLVALQDTNGWVEALGRLVDDVELRRGFAQAGRARIERKFSCTRMVESYLELYLRASEDHARWREQEGGV